jgi:uncharacterized OB-fold protein
MSAYFSLPMFEASSAQRLRLLGAECTACGTLFYPQRTRCTCCGGAAFKEVPLSGQGTIFTFTKIARGGAPSEFDDQQTMTGSLAAGIVELAEGPRVIGQFAEWEDCDLQIGTPVTIAIRRLYDQEGVVRYGLKYVPVMPPGADDGAGIGVKGN